LCCPDQDVNPRYLGSGLFQPFVCVLDHDDGGVDHCADCDRNAAKAHDVGADTEEVHGGKRDQDTDRQHENRDQGATRVQQEQEADQRHDDAFLDEGIRQRLDGSFDQGGTIVDRQDPDTFGQTCCNFRQSRFDRADDVERVCAVPLHGDAACHFAFAIQFGNAAPFVRYELDAGHVTHQDGRTAFDLQDDSLDIGGRADIPAAADHELGFGQFDGTPAHVHIAATHGIADRPEGDPEGPQAQRVDDDRVLFHEAADACDLGHALGLGDPEADLPVLIGA